MLLTDFGMCRSSRVRTAVAKKEEIRGNLGKISPNFVDIGLLSCYSDDMIEKAPTANNSFDIVKLLLDPKVIDAMERVNKDYLYWDKAKYHVPEGVKPEDFWRAVKFSRSLNLQRQVFPCCSISFNEIPSIQEALHDFDMSFGGTLSSGSTISDKNRQYYLISSIMEEAIASSQMEGAVTTRKVAKEMLRKQRKPKDLSQQMILNNYNTIIYLADKKSEPLSAQLLLDVHKHITDNTLDNPEDEGRFRTDDKVVVQNGITGEIVHNPPTWSIIAPSVESICDFINQDKVFIHPIIKAIILHFMIAYLHPFEDGNGRTARSLFYWYMLKKGYWLTEFLSISRVIYKSKAQYEKSFQYTECDGMDLNYFLNYNLDVMKKAFYELQRYLDRKAKEEQALLEFRIPGINERQAQIIKTIVEKGNTVFLCKDLERVMNVSVKTIRSDLEGLVQLGLLEKVPMNKRLSGYTRSPSFESRLREIRGN